MKNKIFFILLFLGSSIHLSAQIYGHEWVNFSQSYYKIPVWDNRMYRITDSVLKAAGIPSNVKASQFRLYREGVEVHLLTTTNDTLSPTDYIEFIGTPATGSLDKELLHDSTALMNPLQSLLWDTSYYFLTIAPLSAPPGKRYVQNVNSLPGTLPAKELFCLDTIRYFLRGNNFGHGIDYDFNANVSFHSSRFEHGEGYIRKLIPNTIDSFDLILPGLFKGTMAPLTSLNLRYSGQSKGMHNLAVYFFEQLAADSAFIDYNYKEYNLSFDQKTIPASFNNIRVKSKTYNPSMNDVAALVSVVAEYPRTFALSNANYEYFIMPPKSSSYYVEFTGGNFGGVSPILFDLNNKTYYVAVMSGTSARFYLPPSASKTNFVLFASTLLPRQVPKSIENINFNSTDLTNDGDFVIFVPKSMLQNTSSTALQDYIAYRSSSAGGSHKVVVKELSDIYNLFGYGYNYHAVGIQRYLKYAQKNWTVKPKSVLMLGKGLAYNTLSLFTKAKQQNPANFSFPDVTPTFGLPGSDILLADLDKNGVPDMNISRLSLYNLNELGDYLTKLKAYEAHQKQANMQYVDSTLWKKRLLHIAGGEGAGTQAIILNGLKRQELVWEDSAIGGWVRTITKDVSNPIAPIQNAEIDSLVQSGLGMIQFYGHSSPYIFEYGLKPADQYSMPYGKYPIFIASGCDGGDFFDYTVGVVNRPLTDLWTKLPNAGSISFIGSVNIGYPGWLDKYGEFLYRELGKIDSDQPISFHLRKTIDSLLKEPVSQGAKDFMRVHTEQIQINGDPEVRLEYYTKPDYVIEDKYIELSPNQPTTNDDSMKVNIVVYNLGKNIRDSVRFTVKQTYANGTTATVFTKKYPNGIAYSDTLKFLIDINPLNSIGMNTLEFKIESDEKIDEISEMNNTVIRQINILDDNIKPAFPYNYAIINENTKLYANTLNPFSISQKYIFQIDTTKLFNSPLFKSGQVQSTGGVVEWDPNIIYKDSVVYYWRVSKDTSVLQPNFDWTTYSFLFLPNVGPGWNQSHYFQYTENQLTDLALPNRNFSYLGGNSVYTFNNAMMFNPAPFNYIYSDFFVGRDGNLDHTSSCNINTLQFSLVDTNTGQFVANHPNPNNTSIGLWNSEYCHRETDNFFEFKFATPAQRQNIMNFLDSIPNNCIVLLGNHCASAASFGNKIFASHMAADTAIFGPNNSLYHKLKSLGFYNIDSFNKNKPFVFSYKKANPLATASVTMGQDSNAKITHNVVQYINAITGYMNTKVIGRAASWTRLIKNEYANGLPNGDSTIISIYGVDDGKNETFLTDVYGKDTSLTWISATQYPYIRLKYTSYDRVLRTAPQLHYWRVHFQPLPDLAIAPNIQFATLDTLDEGRNLPVRFAVKNVTAYPIDSVDVSVKLLNKNNQVLEDVTQRIRPLGKFEQYNCEFNINTSGKAAARTLVMNVNPMQKPDEETFVNNIAIKSQVINIDKTNPILDVVFDGVRIFNNDIVSAYPNISIKLKDENKYLRLDDTSLFKIYLTYPEGQNTKRQIFFDNDTCVFVPASQGGENAAFAKFHPYLPKDGIYELEVQAKDKNGNESGNQSYKVSFQVINKALISNIINYPNPFSTSTQFIFTLTGSQVPDNLKIQIMNIGGRVVREITKAELGNVHIGRNITDYRWDGTDQFGQKLGNGVYFYRISATKNGQSIDKYTIQDVDKFVENGMSKMVLMR